MHGWDAIERVEIVGTNQVIHWAFAIDRESATQGGYESVLVRFEYSWGPWPALGVVGTCD